MSTALGRIALLVVTLVVISGCRSPEPLSDKAKAGHSAAPGGAPEVGGGALRIFVPCGLLIPFQAAIEGFRKAHPEIPVKATYDNHVRLVRQIAGGERADVFVSPGHAEMAYLESQGLIEPGSKIEMGSYVVVLIVPRGNPGGIARLEDLAEARVTSIGLPDPRTNSVGYYARQSLERLGLWDKVSAKVRQTEFAKDSHKLAMQGKVQAAFSFKTCPLPTDPKELAASRVRIVQELPVASYDSARIEVAVLKGSAHPGWAKTLVDYLAEEEGQRLLRANGLPDERKGRR